MTLRKSCDTTASTCSRDCSAWREVVYIVIVDGEGCTLRDVQRERDIFLVEGVAALGASERKHAECGPPSRQRHGQHRVRIELRMRRVWPGPPLMRARSASVMEDSSTGCPVLRGRAMMLRLVSGRTDEPPRAAVPSRILMRQRDAPERAVPGDHVYQRIVCERRRRSGQGIRREPRQVLERHFVIQ